MLRPQSAALYENAGGTITAVHTFDPCNPDAIAAWLERARAAGRYRQLKLIGEPPLVTPIAYA